MLDTKEVYKLQSNYTIADNGGRRSEISYEDYLANCRSYITLNLPKEYTTGGWDAEKKTSLLEKLVTDFISSHPVQVDEYTTLEGVVDKELLLEDLVDSVTGFSILKEALEDPEVDEIQVNDMHTIFVSKGGVLKPYVNSRGKVMQFTTNDEIHTLISRLIDDGTGNVPQFTDGNPILNAKTAKHQYRLNAVHHVANTMDKPPNNYPITSFTLRKFKEVKLTVEDLVKYGACTFEMGKLLKLLGKAELKTFCVGPTGSGKTTLLNIMAQEIPKQKRIILAQNPAEITFFERDEYGRNIRNVVHMEVLDHLPLEAEISNMLRQTPEVIIVGEARDKSEFYQINRVGRTGHVIFGTFHAEDSQDAVSRFATELSSETGSSYIESVRLSADLMDIVISQYKFPDGRRRIMEISEIIDADMTGKVHVNKLFEFQMSGEIRINEHGLSEVLGEFKQVGYLTERTQKAFFKAGVGKKDLKEFLKPEDVVV